MRNTIISGLFGLAIGAAVGALLSRPVGFEMLGGSAGAGDIVAIGTGGVSGVYYPAGGAICLLVNRSRAEHGVRCSVESTEGSVYNLTAIRAGILDIGVAQSDWQFHALKGTSQFDGKGPDTGLRTLFSLYSETFTVVARADAGIRTFEDLKGKRVNIGNPGSGHRGTMEVLMKAMGWGRDTFAAVSELKSRDQSAALCAGAIDAMVFTVGHPSATIKEATTSCDSVIVAVTGPMVDRLVRENDYYRRAAVPGGMYRGNPEDVMTFALSATVVTSDRISPDVAYHVVKSVFENLDRFKSLHPAFKNLRKEAMVKEGLSAPLHEGANRYYREAGLP